MLIKVPQASVDELNYANSFFPALNAFVKKITGKKKSGSSLLIQRDKFSFVYNLFEFDTEPVRVTLEKLISFCNDSINPDPLEQDGIPLEDHQKLLFEQLVRTNQFFFYANCSNSVCGENSRYIGSLVWWRSGTLGIK